VLFAVAELLVFLFVIHPSSLTLVVVVEVQRENSVFDSCFTHLDDPVQHIFSSVAALYQGAAEQMTYLKLPVAAGYKLAGQIFVSSNIGINRRNKNNQKKIT